MLGTMGKIFLFIFVIDMGFYLFAEQLGTDKFLIEEDLFRDIVNVTGDRTVEQGALLTGTTGKFGTVKGNDTDTILRSTETSGLTAILTLFDPLWNLLKYVKLAFGTVINIFTAPIFIISALVDKGAPMQIVLLIFAPIILLTIIGFWSLLRGKDI